MRLDDERGADRVVPGSFAVWDPEPCAVAGDRLVGRACDDLAGVAVGLATLERLVDEGVGRAALLLTRAEETGFGGLLGAIASGSLPEDAVYVDIECSSCRAGAPLGEGPAIRVGDRRWLFDAGITGGLIAVAEALARDDGGFRFQRRLLDGGFCEATPLARSGRATGAVAFCPSTTTTTTAALICAPQPSTCATRWVSWRCSCASGATPARPGPRHARRSAGSRTCWRRGCARAPGPSPRRSPGPPAPGTHGWDGRCDHSALGVDRLAACCVWLTSAP